MYQNTTVKNVSSNLKVVVLKVVLN